MPETPRQPVGWAGFIKPNIGDSVEEDVGQTIRLFTQPTDCDHGFRCLTFENKALAYAGVTEQ